MSESGLLLEVKWEWDGTTVSTAVTGIGATGLTVDDVAALSEEESVWIGEGGPYDIVVLDEDNGNITIDPGLTEAVEEGDPVVPDVGGQPARVWVAVVLLPDTDEPIEVPLVFTDLLAMPEGVYDPPLAIYIADDLESVVDLPGQLPTIDGVLIPPDTLPPPVTSDGDAPPFSPQPEVIAGIGAFFLRWTPPPNDDSMSFEVYVSADAGFVPTEDTFYSQTDGYSMTVRHLGLIDPVTGEPFPFEYTTEGDDGEDHPYYFRVIAKDVDGSAAPGAETESRLFQISGPDVRAKTITGENIVANTLTGDLFSGQIVLGSTISTGALDEDGSIVGSRIELGPGGFRVVQVDGLGNEIDIFFVPLNALDSAKMRANFEMLSAQVLDNFSLFGTHNQIATEAELYLANGVIPPTAIPTVGWAYEQVQFDTISVVGAAVTGGGNLGSFALDASQIKSLAWDDTNNKWAVVQQRTTGARIWYFDTDGDIATHAGTGLPWTVDLLNASNVSIAHGDDGVSTGIGLLYNLTTSAFWFIIGPSGLRNKVSTTWLTDISTRPPTLGYDDVNDDWMLAQSNGGGAGRFEVRRLTFDSTYDDFLIVMSVTQGDLTTGINQRPNGIYYGAADFGSNRYVWTVDNFLTQYVFNTTGGITIDDLRNTDGAYEIWTSPGPKLGMAYDGSNFHTVDSNGVLTKYTGWNWLEASAQAWIGLSAYDSDTAGVSSGAAAPHAGQSAGQHETPVGTITGFTMQRRANMVTTLPPTQDNGGVDDADTWKAYWVRMTSSPVTASVLDLAGSGGNPDGQESFSISADPTGGPPPGGISGLVGAVNNFPAGTPAMLASAAIDGLGDHYIRLKGDGSGRTGPLQWDAIGDVTHTPLPIGSVLSYAGASVPTGFLLCDGAAVSRTTYSKLFTAIGIVWGAGDGSTTFNLPDLRRRALYGTSAASLTLALGANDGLAIGSRALGHNHTITGKTMQDAQNTATGGANAGRLTGIAGNIDHDHGGNTGNTAQPYAGVNHVIKALAS